jgi:hypothetical protein
LGSPFRAAGEAGPRSPEGTSEAVVRSMAGTPGR